MRLKSIIFLTIFYLVVLTSCKEESIKDVIWKSGQTYFQITDSLVYFNNGPERDYFYEIKGDSIFLNNGTCSHDNHTFHMEILDGKLILTGYNDYYKELWFKDTTRIGYLERFTFEKDINSDYIISPEITIQKISKISYDCKIEGSWYESKSHKMVIFENDSAYLIDLTPDFLSFPLVYKGVYQCFNNESFYISADCFSVLFEVKYKDDSIIKLNSSFFEEIEFKRFADVSFNESITIENILNEIGDNTNFDSIYLYRDSLSQFNLNQLSN